MKLSPFFFSLILSATLFSCAREKDKPATVSANSTTIERPNMSWGLPFEFLPARKTKAPVQEAGKAVAFVRYAEGTGATGFFISEDGLFLTNEHVISRDFCIKSRCAGVQIIRDFRDGGDLEVFESFEILAHNKEVDVALLKVNLAPGKKVPFLKISQRNDYSPSDPLLIIGHPYGASLHVSPSRIDKANNPEATYFRSVSMGGNSGSPIVDAKTLEVVAIHNASSRRDSRIERSGVVHGFGMGILARNFEIMIKTLDPSFTTASPRFTLRAATHSLSARESQVAPPASPPENMTIEIFARTAVGTELEKTSLRKLIEMQAAKTFSERHIGSLFDSLITLDLNRGRKLSIVAEELKELLPSDWKWPENVKNFYLGGAKEECLKSVSQFQNLRIQFLTIATDCLSPVQHGGENAFAMLERIFEEHKDKSWGDDYENFNSIIIFGIESHLLLRPQLKPEEVALLKKVLAKIGSDTALMTHYFNADQILTLISEKPELVAPGSFRSL